MSALLTTRPALGVDALAELVREAATDTATWSPLVRYAASGRWWTRLAGDDGHDVWLLSWLRDQTTDLHDHGRSAGAFTVVSGALREIRPAGPRLTSTRLVAGTVQTVRTGVVHDVGNPWHAPAVSIHAYSPPLSSMTFYRRTATGVAPVETRRTDGPEA
jgi:hypothetical protein